MPLEPGRFAEMYSAAGARFGAGFLERSHQAVAAYRAHAFLACCAMCGAAAESVILALAIAKRGGDEDGTLKLYVRPDGRKKIEDIVLNGQSASVRREFEAYTGLLKYWRDASAHGRAVKISEPEAYSSLALLLRFARFADDQWAALTST